MCCDCFVFDKNVFELIVCEEEIESDYEDLN